MKYMLSLLFVAALVVAARAQDSTFLEVEIRFDRIGGTIAALTPTDTFRSEFRFADVRRSGRQISIGERALIQGDSLLLGGQAFDLSAMRVRDLFSKGESCEVILARFLERGRSYRLGARNRFAAFETLLIPNRDFVRGDAICVGGEVVVEGEVNGNVVSLFGDVRLAATAICHRDVFAIGGKVQKHRQARLHGTYQSTESWKRYRIGRKDKSHIDKSTVGFTGDVSYDRVDGLALFGKVAFQSEERFLPRFYFDYGYGFSSKVSKYRLGIEQRLFDYNQTAIGGSVYRLTKTEDEWACSEIENTLYALLMREDFRDYYQGEGGNLYFEQTFGYLHTLRLAYSYEQLEFMPAYTGLWSLFGGDKRFRANFSSVAAPLRDKYLPDFDKEEALLEASYVYNSVEDEQGKLSRAGWVFGVNYQHSSKRLGSDFDYDRYRIEVRRYQPLTYRQNLNFRLLYAGATGRLPLHRYFYLGGIRTLRGFDIKEFYGSRMALANVEYVVNFPKTTLGLVALFDIGKTGWCSRFLSEGSWYGDVGCGLQVAEGLRIELTRQINGSSDKLQPSVLIGRSF